MEVLLAALILILDQGTKLWAHSVLRAKPLVLIPGALELTYLENRGAVWGLMQGWRIVFLIATFLFLGIMLWFYIRKRRDMSLLTRIILALLFSGAVGNLIDRLFLGYVRDMIYFSLINFPVFNVADIFVTCGTAAAAVYYLKYYEKYDAGKKEKKKADGTDPSDNGKP